MKIYATFTTTSGSKVTITVSERRRYGNRTRTWLNCQTNDDDVTWMGDPWPMINPPFSGLVWQLRCMGHDIKPSACDIKYAKELLTQKRTIQISPEDRTQFIFKPKPTTITDRFPLLKKFATA